MEDKAEHCTPTAKRGPLPLRRGPLPLRRGPVPLRPAQTAEGTARPGQARPQERGACKERSACKACTTISPICAVFSSCFARSSRHSCSARARTCPAHGDTLPCVERYALTPPRSTRPDRRPSSSLRESRQPQPPVAHTQLHVGIRVRQSCAASERARTGASARRGRTSTTRNQRVGRSGGRRGACACAGVPRRRMRVRARRGAVSACGSVSACSWWTVPIIAVTACR